MLGRAPKRSTQHSWFEHIKLKLRQKREENKRANVWIHCGRKKYIHIDRVEHWINGNKDGEEDEKQAAENTHHSQTNRIPFQCTFFPAVSEHERYSSNPLYCVRISPLINPSIHFFFLSFLPPFFAFAKRATPIQRKKPLWQCVWI